MPPPSRSRRPSPEELAKQIAARLAEKDVPNSNRVPLRDSVLFARLVSGTIVLGTAAALVLGIFAGVDLLLGNASAEPPQVLSSGMSNEDQPTTTIGVPLTRNLEDFIGLSADNPAEMAGLGLVTTTIPGGEGIGVPVPAAPTTSTTAPADRSSTTVGSNTTTPPEVTTTQPPTTTSSGASMTSTSTSTSTTPNPANPSTTTTVRAPTTTVATTTTSIATTTTTEASTTTPVEDTTTTCGNNGTGKGNC